MKGPFERLKYDLRRLWECPNCKRRERTDGGVTFRFCPCPGKGRDGKLTVMKLVEEAGHRAVPEIKYQPREEGAVDSPTEPIRTSEEAQPAGEATPPPADQSAAEVTPPAWPLP